MVGELGWNVTEHDLVWDPDVASRTGKLMRILWNNHRDIRNPRAGGAERTIHEVGSRLVERGHQVTVLTSRWKGAPAEEYVGGVRILRYPGNLLPHLVLPIIASSAVRPEVVVDDLAHAVPWASSWLSSAPGTVFFRHLHARTLPGQVSLPLARFLTAVERRYPSIYGTWPFVTESEGSLEDLVSLGIPRQQCVRIPPGVDVEQFVPRPKSGAPTLIYFGGLRDYKRPEHAILVHKSLMERGWDVRLTVVGEGVSLRGLRRMAKSLGVDDTVTFVGRVGQDELARLVAEAWANIHCSVNEGWGYSVMEAAAAGTPTAAYRVKGIVDSIQDKRTGLLVTDGDLGSLVDATESLLRGGQEWSRHCRLWAQRFDWESTASAWEHHLAHVAGSSDSGTVGGRR